MKSLRTRITASIALVVLIAVAFISLLSNLLIERRFTEYIRKQQDNRIETITATLQVLYHADTGTWNAAAVHAIGMHSLYDGYILRLSDTDDKTVWDAQSHDMSLCAQIMDKISERMDRRYPQIHGSFSSTVYPLSHNGKQIGSVRVAYFGPVFFTENESLFLDALNILFAVTGFLAFALAIFVGLMTAKRLNRPILRTVEAAEQISAGRTDIRISEEDADAADEIRLLTRSINRMAASLERQDALRKQLSADVAHELRTPLTTLQTHLEMMLDGVWQPTAERLQSCYDEAGRITKLVRDLESIARTENSLDALDKSHFSLQELLDAVIASFEASLQKKNLTVTVLGDCSPVFADKDKIQQVLVNLLSNAVKYSDPGGVITFSLSESGGMTAVSVSDRGDGIAEEDLPYVFERFYRADKSRDRTTGGSGLGLSIVRSIVHAHGGTVSAHSKPNEGSTFRFTIPHA